MNLIALCPLLAQQSTLKAEYFNGTNFEEKVTTRTEANIDKTWNDMPPVPGLDPHFCSIRWTGRITAPETGTYTFSARVDDGIRVWVGGVQVIDNWQLNDNAELFAKVDNLLDEEYVASRRPSGVRPGKPQTMSVGVRLVF